MIIDAHDKARLLLNAIANSLYERDPSNEKPIFFSLTQINLVEEFIIDLIKEHDAE